jgi:hypothetical protein
VRRGSMMHKNKINLAKVLAALNTICPKCGYSISPAQIMRVDSERSALPRVRAHLCTQEIPTRRRYNLRPYARPVPPHIPLR